MQLKIFFRAYPETSRCPSCGRIGSVRRSRSKNLPEVVVKATRLVGVYKCTECGWRGYLRKYTFNFYSLLTASFYLLLIISVAYIITKVLKQNFGE